MRTIKFRAWDILGKRMVFSYTPEIQEKREYTFIEFGVGYSGFNTKKFEIMQYTGLNDTKGCEIYEGDIIRIFQEGHFNMVGQVIFSNGGYVFEQINGELKCPLFIFMSISDYELPISIEIQGNIYKNTNL